MAETFDNTEKLVDPEDSEKTGKEDREPVNGSETEDFDLLAVKAPAGSASAGEEVPADKESGQDPENAGISPEDEEIINSFLTPLDEYAKKEKARFKKNQKILGGCYEWLGSFVYALLFVVVLFTFILRLVRVQGESMWPTLNSEDYLVISNLAYEPKTGDIVVLQVPSYKSGHPLIKRVIATGGQKVHIDYENWTVTVDGVTLNETYLNRDSRPMSRLDNCPTDFVVKEGYVFVMGDNRNNSTDSRSSLIGQIDERYLMGRVVFRLFSLSPLGTETNPLLSPFAESKDAD
ncbi:MAG: signal peptidase I [Clostridia bacterium]|nr:signal peptidase I [Clostridia bacterium]